MLLLLASMSCHRADPLMLPRVLLAPGAHLAAFAASAAAAHHLHDPGPLEFMPSQEEMREGSDLFTVHAYLPAEASFGFADELRRRSSGAATASLMLSHWERLQVRGTGCGHVDWSPRPARGCTRQLSCPRTSLCCHLVLPYAALCCLCCCRMPPHRLHAAACCRIGSAASH